MLFLWLNPNSTMPTPPLDYPAVKEKTVEGRYVTYSHIAPLIQKRALKGQVEKVGESVAGRSIETITLGQGPNKILMWSQMHGNESTTTKAVFDLLNFLESDQELALEILLACTIKIIPMLNPDGAEAYTRVNANMVDLNRDAKERSQPESLILREVYEQFGPDYCFNLHDQRTIFNVGVSKKPATLSFLAPAHDAERNVSTTRGIAMQLIVAMNQLLQVLIPGQVGRYDDAFNDNCIGDTFQMLGTPTVLFEAGHFPNDYARERTREFIFMALSHALKTISEHRIGQYKQEEYLTIPENNKHFYDVLISNVHLINPKYDEDTALGVLYQETLKADQILFEPKIDVILVSSGYFGHINYDCADQSELLELSKCGFWRDISE